MPKGSVLKKAADLLIKARDENSHIEMSRPSDILTIVANALAKAAEEDGEEPKLALAQELMLHELKGLEDQIKKGHYLNAHFRAFKLANMAWQEHMRVNAVAQAKEEL